jgi:hypothetical protein
VCTWWFIHRVVLLLLALAKDGVVALGHALLGDLDNLGELHVLGPGTVETAVVRANHVGDATAIAEDDIPRGSVVGVDGGTAHVAGAVGVLPLALALVSVTALALALAPALARTLSLSPSPSCTHTRVIFCRIA